MAQEMIDIIPLRKKYKYESLVREDRPEGRVYVYGDTKLPSVTTILSSTKDNKELDAWAERVGQEKAALIKNEAATVGTHMHMVMDRMIACRDLPRPTNWLMLRGYEMGYRLINTFFPNVDEIWGSEVSLYYPEKYAGTADMVCVYRNKPCIVDFKQSVRPKKKEWIRDYFHQLSAYAMAHDIVHGTSIDQGAILISVQDGTTQEFTTSGREFQQYKAEWMRRVETYLTTTTSPSVSIQTCAPQDNGLSGL
jgi:genome maintenance exonuclease 1